MKIELGFKTAEADKQVLEKKIKVLKRSLECLKEDNRKIPKELTDLIESLETKLKLLS